MSTVAERAGVGDAEVIGVSSPLKFPQQLEPPDTAETVQRPSEPSQLIEALIQAARDGDRDRFDECFDRCFDELWTHAFRTTQDQKQAEKLTEQILFDIVRGR